MFAPVPNIATDDQDGGFCSVSPLRLPFSQSGRDRYAPWHATTVCSERPKDTKLAEKKASLTFTYVASVVFTQSLWIFSFCYTWTCVWVATDNYRKKRKFRTSNPEQTSGLNSFQASFSRYSQASTVEKKRNVFSESSVIPCERAAATVLSIINHTWICFLPGNSY